MGSNNIILNKCIVCGKKINKNFYDKSVYRPICSRAHYSKYIDNLPKRYEKKLHHGDVEIKEPSYEYYKRGRLILANYNLNINW
jgi:hypothetical protein